MDENSKKIRELTEAMRTERDIRIRNRMMAVLGVLKGHSTRIASDFADVDRRTVQLWVVRFDEDDIDGLRDAPGRGRASRTRYGLIRKLADRLAGKNMLTPRKLRNWIRGRLDARYSLCSVRRILRFLGFSSKRSATIEVIRYYFSSLPTLLFRPVSVRLPVLPATTTFDLPIRTRRR